MGIDGGPELARESGIKNPNAAIRELLEIYIDTRAYAKAAKDLEN